MNLFRFLIIFILINSSLFATGNLSLAIKINNFGYRPEDSKVAVITQNPGSEVQIRRSSDDSIAWSVSSSSITNKGQDEDSGDYCWIADFTGLNEEGSFYVYVPSLNIRSYEFEIYPWIYNRVGEVVVKSFYYQRCNHKKEEPYSGPWQDGVCHTNDFHLSRWTGGNLAGHGYIGPQPNYGILDLHGGWHDAGDYQKTPHWGRGVIQLLWAYEVNPSVWKDGQLNIPESGNGIPDILDEISWELDFYVRCQRPDGKFLSAVGGHDGSISSPPSANNEIRGYINAFSNEATARSVAKLAHAAFIYRNLGINSKADIYENAATNGWKWLLGRNLTGSENKLKCVAAASVWRMNPSITSAKNFVESWSGGWNVQCNDTDFINAIWYYLSCSGTSPAIVNSMKSAIAGDNWNGVVNQIFYNRGVYGGLRGDKDNGWDWHWGSNVNQGAYGFNLMMALKFGITGSYTPKSITNQSQKYLHFLLGRNTLSMVYLTSMHSYGGEHSSFQLFHSWFSMTGGDGDHGNIYYNGKPNSVNEPFYPYYPADNQTSLYGPAPGLLVGGPNYYYSGSYSPPLGAVYPARFYRDFSVSCDGDGSKCRAMSWEITENSLGYSGPLVALLSFFMKNNDPKLTGIVKAYFITNDFLINIIWNNEKGTNITYKILRKVTGLETITNNTGTATNFSDTNISWGRTYTYTVLVYQNGTFSYQLKSVTVSVPRMIIKNFTLSYVKKQNEIHLSWDPLPYDGILYEVIKSEDGNEISIFPLTDPYYEDTNVISSKTYIYKITARTNSHIFAESEEKTIDIPGMTEGSEVRNNLLKSKDDTAEIRINITSLEEVKIYIYNAEGMIVKKFSIQPSLTGIVESVFWKGDDSSGKPVPAGVYMVKITSGNYKAIHKVMIIRN